MLIEKYKWELKIWDLEISCSVLDDGMRIFSQRSFAEYIGSRGSAKYFQDKKNGKRVLPEFLSLSTLSPYVPENLKDIIFIKYKSWNTIREWIDATLIPEICDVWINALNAGVLNKKQQETAIKCQKLISAFAKVGIIALVDEATWYQYDREKDELQKILKAYISEELLPWQKRFPDIFYKELFRLNGRDFTQKGIKKRPSVIGKWTNIVIYEQLPPGVLEELKKHTPKNDAGNYTARFHQSLTPDMWNTHLQTQITEVITLFRLSDNMQDFWMRFNELQRRKAWQLPLPFSFDDKWHTVESPSKNKK